MFLALLRLYLQFVWHLQIFLKVDQPLTCSVSILDLHFVEEGVFA